MGNAHYFFVDDLGGFLRNLEARRYARSYSQEGTKRYIFYSKTFSNAVIKHYSLIDANSPIPVQIRVTYGLIGNGSRLAALTKKLKLLNTRYRDSLPGWKTKQKARTGVRERRWADIQKFFHEHHELSACFKYEGDNRLTEGNHSFNLEIASTPSEQTACFDFIKALIDAYAPHGIIRARRQPDKPRQQRDGWIKRYAGLHKKRGWTPLEISKEIQKELREGTWNERAKLQYNLAQNTICRIAGMKLHHTVHHDAQWN